MRIVFYRPSAFESSIVPPEDHASLPDLVQPPMLVLNPLQPSKGQRILHLLPVEVKNDLGVTTDRGFLSVSATTGKLSFDRIDTGVKSPVDQNPTPPSEESDGKQ